MAIKRLHTNSRLSEVVLHGDLVYLAGQIAESFGGGIEDQTRQTLAVTEQMLADAGTDKQHLLSVTIYLADIGAHFAAMNTVWDEWLPAGTAPARATIGARLSEPAILVEMSVIAALPA